MAEFPDLGKHCEVPSCKQLDFLPFTCEACNKTFCLEHRSYDAHSCTKSPQGKTVVVCGECGKGVDVRGGDTDGALAYHLAHNCRGAQKKVKCLVPGCKAKMGVTGTTCKLCNQPVCLTHRFEKDHNCPGLKGNNNNNKNKNKNNNNNNNNRRNDGGRGREDKRKSKGRGYGSNHSSSSSSSSSRSQQAPLCSDCVIC